MPLPKRRLAKLTGGKIRDITPSRPVLLPLGSHEDQGPHTPIGDYLSAEDVATSIVNPATDTGTETYVPAVVPFGGAGYFASKPGRVSLSQSSLRPAPDDMLSCLPRHNLNRIVVINGHAGNVQTVHDATQQVWLDGSVVEPPADVRGMTVSGFGTLNFESVEIAVPLEVAPIASSGVLKANPRLCSPETGAALVEQLTDIGARVACWDT